MPRYNENRATFIGTAISVIISVAVCIFFYGKIGSDDWFKVVFYCFVGTSFAGAGAGLVAIFLNWRFEKKYSKRPQFPRDD